MPIKIAANSPPSSRELDPCWGHLPLTFSRTRSTFFVEKSYAWRAWVELRARVREALAPRRAGRDAAAAGAGGGGRREAQPVPEPADGGDGCEVALGHVHIFDGLFAFDGN